MEKTAPISVRAKNIYAVFPSCCQGSDVFAFTEKPGSVPNLSKMLSPLSLFKSLKKAISNRDEEDKGDENQTKAWMGVTDQPPAGIIILKKSVEPQRHKVTN